MLPWCKQCLDDDCDSRVLLHHFYGAAVLSSHWFADDIVNHVDDAEVSKDMKRMTRDDVENSESLCDDVSPWYVCSPCDA